MPIKNKKGEKLSLFSLIESTTLSSRLPEKTKKMAKPQVKNELFGVECFIRRN